MDFVLPESPAIDDKLGRRMVKLYSDMLNDYSMDARVRIGYPLPSGGMDWKWRYPEVVDGKHPYRAVLPNEIVFDIGDNTNWVQTVADTHALWRALNELQIPYLGCLSGGRGTHTHIWGPMLEASADLCLLCLHAVADHDDGCSNDCDCINPYYSRGERQDWRRRTASSILAVASMVKWNDEWGPAIPHDPLLVDPNHGARMVREFGHVKEDYNEAGPKSVWIRGPAEFEELPYVRAEAYRIARERGLDYPYALPASQDVPAGYWHDVQSFTSGPCPTKPACIRSRCDDCPFRAEV